MLNQANRLLAVALYSAHRHESDIDLLSWLSAKKGQILPNAELFLVLTLHCSYRNVLCIYTHSPKIKDIWHLWKLLGPPLEFKMKSSGSEQCLTVQHECVMTDPPRSKKLKPLDIFTEPTVLFLTAWYDIDHAGLYMCISTMVCTWMACLHGK